MAISFFRRKLKKTPSLLVRLLVTPHQNSGTFFFNLLTLCYDFHLEPTSNLAPKNQGKRIDGSIVQEYSSGGDALITCDVTGYPVPRYK